MSQWSGASRSNYFRVKDEATFRKWAKRRGLGILESRKDGGRFAIYPEDSSDDGSWPSYCLKTNTEIDIASELSKHLAKGEIAILMSAGADKLRYITGEALAVNDRGSVLSLTLDEIYLRAARRFRVPVSSITQADY
jgi:hypothetical protein